MPTTPSNALDAARALALSPKEGSEHCYCSALPSGIGPCLPCYGHRLRLAEAFRRRLQPCSPHPDEIKSATSAPS
jgi:hypothetical protein